WDKCKEDNLCWMRTLLERAPAGEAVALARSALGEAALPARLAPSDGRPVPAVDGLVTPSLYTGIEHVYRDGGFELPLVNKIAALRGDQLGAIQLEGDDAKVGRDAVLAAKAPGCKTKAGRTYVWMVRDRNAEGRERVRALLLVRCGRVEVRDGNEDVALP